MRVSEGGPSLCPHSLGLVVPPESRWNKVTVGQPLPLPAVRKASLRRERASLYAEERCSFLSDENLFWILFPLGWAQLPQMTR